MSFVKNYDVFIYHLQTTVIFDVLDNVLKENNRESFSILQEDGVGSEGVLDNVQRYGLYVARVLGMQDGPMQRTSFGENIGRSINYYHKIFF